MNLHKREEKVQRHDIKIGLNICFLSFVFVNNLIDNICERKSFDFLPMFEHISLLDVQIFIF